MNEFNLITKENLLYSRFSDYSNKILRTTLLAGTILIPSSLYSGVIPISTPSPTPTSKCMCDCNMDGYVTIDELMTSVNIGLFRKPLNLCESSNRDNNKIVTIDELVNCVNNSLNGCK